MVRAVVAPVETVMLLMETVVWLVTVGLLVVVNLRF